MLKPFIQVKELTKHYPMGGTTVRALDGLTLDINADTFTVVMGPSGSGKSTLLYLLGGLDRVPPVRFLWMAPGRMKWMKTHWPSFAAGRWVSFSSLLTSSPV